MGSPDLSGLARHIDAHLEVVNANVSQALKHIAVVSGQVETVAQQQTATHDRLEGLYAEFQEFIATDARQKERQFAATRVIEVRQELEKRFGHYAEVRRHTTGILQATDVGIV